MKPDNKMNFVLTEAQMHYYQTTNVGKGTGQIVEIDWSEPVESIAEVNGIDSSESTEKKYYPNQVLTNKQIDILTAPNSTWKGGVIAESIDFEGAQMALSQYEMEYLQALDCVVDIGKAIVADLESMDSEGEFTNQVFSAELISKVNKERPWTGGVVVAETGFTDESSCAYEIREIIKAIAAFHKHTFKNTSLGYMIRAGQRRLNITHDGLVGGYFSVKPFDGFDDYDFWINKVKTDSYGTVIADNIAFHLSKTKNAAGKFSRLEMV